MNRRDFLDRLKEGILLFDEGIGTQLQARGLGVGEAPESWNLEHRDWVKEVHQGYVEVGA